MATDDASGREGWRYSADAYIAFQGEGGDAARRLLLDPVMLEQCGDVAGRDVLDLGCGEGRFSRMLGERGARTTGLDVTARMVEVARERDRHGGAYVLGSGERPPFTDASFDLVVSYITLVDMPDYRAAIAESARVLRPGGRFVAANLGFVTASWGVTAESGWVRDGDGRRLYRALDRYVEEFAQVYEWSGIRITNWHRPLSHYMQAYLSAGLELRAFIEPAPPDDSLRDDPYFEDWYRVPEFTVMAWEKPPVRPRE